MGGEEVGLVQPQNPMNPQQQHHHHNHQLLFQGGALGYAHAVDPNPKARDLAPSRFLEPHYFPSNPQGPNLFGESPVRNWDGGGSDGSEADDNEEDEDLDDDDQDEMDEREGLAGFVDGSNSKSGREGGCNDNNSNDSDGVKKDCGSNNNGSSSSSGVTVHGGMIKLGNGKTKIAFSGKDANMVQAMDLSDVRATCGVIGSYQNAAAVTETDGEFYYSHYLDGNGESGSKRRDVGMDDNNCGFSGRKDVSSSGESCESLRAILSDPVTGTLMEDAMILLCGHSFGSGGMQQVIRMKACPTCSQPLSEESILPNHSLREAVQAFLREEELNQRSSKRRKEKFEQDRGGYNDTNPVDAVRGRGVQFPFSVTDRVIIKGNKRTPERFVGREAVVTMQCLNGWYVVKTLDNAESVKLQYRSLAKVSDELSKKVLPSKMAPKWL